MTKKELAAAVAKKAEVTNVAAQKTIDALLEVITEELKAGNKVALNGVVTIDVVEKPARMGRNPRTGEVKEVAACKAPKFKAAKALKDAVNA